MEFDFKAISDTLILETAGKDRLQTSQSNQIQTLICYIEDKIGFSIITSFLITKRLS